MRRWSLHAPACASAFAGSIVGGKRFKFNIDLHFSGYSRHPPANAKIAPRPTKITMVRRPRKTGQGNLTEPACGAESYLTPRRQPAGQAPRRDPALSQAERALRSAYVADKAGKQPVWTITTAGRCVGYPGAMDKFVKNQEVCEKKWQYLRVYTLTSHTTRNA